MVCLFPVGDAAWDLLGWKSCSRAVVVGGGVGSGVTLKTQVDILAKVL